MQSVYGCMQAACSRMHAACRMHIPPVGSVFASYLCNVCYMSVKFLLRGNASFMFRLSVTLSYLTVECFYVDP